MKKIQYNGSSKILNGIVTKVNLIIDKLVVDVKVNGTSVVVVNEEGEREADIDLSLADQNVKQSPTTDNKDYRVLLSKSDNDTEETDIARKNTNLKYNPSTGNLQATKLNGNTIPSGSGTDTLAKTSDIPDMSDYIQKSLTVGLIKNDGTIDQSDYVESSDLATVATSGSYNDLIDTPTIPAGQIQSDWEQYDDTEVDYIKNKPTIPTVNDGKLTINQNGNLIGEFTANDSDDVTVNLTDTTYTASGVVSIDANNNITSTAEVNQNAFGKIKVGSTTTTASAKQDTLTLKEGTNTSLSINGKEVTINATDTTYTASGLVSIDASNNITTTAEVNQNTFAKVKVGSTTITADAKQDTLELVQGTNITLTPDATNDKVTIATTAEVNQNAFSNVKVGDTTVEADTKTDTLELVAGTNVTLTADATNDKITIASTDTNTHRPIKMNGTQILGDNTTALNLKAGDNMTLSNSSGTVTFTATDTTYESKAASSGGTDLSLVTTGEKYIWNSKAVSDENVKQIADTVTSWRRLALVENNDTEKNSNVFKNSSFWCCTSPIGTTSTVGKSFLAIGNNTSSGTAGNSKGYLRIYGENNKRSQITINGSVTADREVYLPNKDGTIALTTDLPTVNNNTISITQNGTAVDSFTLNQNSNKTINVKDEKVKQTSLTYLDDNNYRILLSKSATDSEETDGVNKYGAFYYNPAQDKLTVTNADITSATMRSLTVIELLTAQYYFQNGSGNVVAMLEANGSSSPTNPTMLYLPSESGTLVNDKDAVLWTQNNLLGAKNLLPYPWYATTITKDGITFKDNGDGSITVNGTATANTTFYFIVRSDKNWRLELPKGSYTLTGCPSGGSDTTYSLYFNAYRKGTSTAQGGLRDSGNGGTQTYSYDLWMGGYIDIKLGTVCNNLVFNPMLRMSSIADSTYQQFAKTNRQLTVDKMDWNKYGEYGGYKNMIHYPWYHPNGRVNRGITFNYYGEGYITLNGTGDASNQPFFCYSYPSVDTIQNGTCIKLLGGMTYVLSLEKTKNPIFSIIYLRDSSGTATAKYSDIRAVYEDGTIQEGNVNQISLRYNSVNHTSVTFTLYTEGEYYIQLDLRVYANAGTFNSDTDMGRVMLRLASFSDSTWANYAATNYELSRYKADYSQIATVEDIDYASKAYSINDFMIWRGGLYKVISPISSGGQITTAKVQATTLADQLREIRNALDI